MKLVGSDVIGFMPEFKKGLDGVRCGQQQCHYCLLATNSTHGCRITWTYCPQCPLQMLALKLANVFRIIIMRYILYIIRQDVIRKPKDNMAQNGGKMNK